MKTPITYYGGKQTMLKHILPLIPEHQLYTEAFCGGAALLFAKDPSRAEIINDLNRNLTTFYWMASVNYPDLKKEIDSTLHSRDVHAHAVHIYRYPQFHSNVQIAWAVWAISKLSFASKLDGTFGYDLGGTQPMRLNNAKDNFTQELCDRLKRVTIENRDALKVIRTYDKPEAFHFVDPPYINSNCGHYSEMFSEDDLKNLLTLLSEIKGKFMLTMFPLELIETFAKENNWTIHRINRFVSASRSKRRQQEEWIVCNY